MSENQPKIDAYIRLLLKWNEYVRFTKFSTYEQIHANLVVPSMYFAELIKTPGKILDIGTGPGIPGLVLAIANPVCQFTLIDSKIQAVEFIEECRTVLKLQNVKTFDGRAEIFARDPMHREKYDYVVSRSMAPLPVTLEISAGFVSVQGKVLVGLSRKNRKLFHVKHFLEKAGLSWTGTHEFGRYCIGEFLKDKPCRSGYPRSWKSMKSEPLF